MRYKRTPKAPTVATDGPTAAFWKPGGGAARIRLSTGRLVAEDELSPVARAMLDKSAVIDDESFPGLHTPSRDRRQWVGTPRAAV